MPRPRNFDPQHAIDAALDQFWGASYATTSTEDLCEQTGLSRSSLYNTFDSKAELYRTSLRRYAELKDAERRCFLDQGGTGRERLTALLTQVLAGQQEFDDRRSCLMVNAAVEIGRSDADVAALARKGLADFRGLLGELIAAGQRDGSLRADRPAAELAVIVHATLNGLQVAGRVAEPGAPDPAVDAAVDTLLGLL
ncbi:TetR/AcrR family transcriptional regulator [Nakamurella lactea]|uniref:TetR/AcrR family transcriptional regulator n=1 Tax=Nakamurella lactea TaxID=459515 RepID=UPI0004074651|nr:TetR/AcrR family transcriptional regulator [Nakamurella lactea]